jgi:NADH dehydrogenase [ubiquinone] 1 alpha subcomplex assembly factor 7
LADRARTPGMTELAAILARQIAATGPITLADYMASCLMHPLHGYYVSRTPFGRNGDFITAPEISQMYGELLGLCLAQIWMDQGSVGAFTLAELGPGRGTLMADVLRATAKVPGFHAAMKIHLVERSQALRAVQRAALRGFAVTWHDDVATLPEAPLFLLANEFFDALPIRQFVRVSEGWSETMIGMTDAKLAYGRGLPTMQATLAHRLADTMVGDIVEICSPAGSIMQVIAQRIGGCRGAALIADYGAWGAKGDTFQAVRDHRYVDPLAEPGLADLTAHVDFAALAEAGTGLRHAFTTQGAFLSRLGIAARSAQLAKGLAGDALASHLAACDRLTSPSEMGQLFKILVLAPDGCPPIPGFA